MDITEKVWFIAIDGKSEGAYSFLDLDRDDRVTPDTPVWKEGWPEWKKIKEVEELDQLFTDKKKQEAEREEDEKALFGDEETIAMDESIPPWIFLWIIAIVIAIIYLWQLYHT